MGRKIPEGNPRIQGQRVFATVRPPKGAKILGTTRLRPAVSILKSIMVYWINERCACVFLGIINQKTASMLLIYILPFWKLPKLDYWQQLQQNIFCPLLKTDTKQAFLYGDMGDYKVCIRLSESWLVAKAYSWRSCSLTSQKHLWHKGRRMKVAHSHFWMDGEKRIPCR